MIDHTDTLDIVGQDLDEARVKIETVRDALQAVLDAQGGEELRRIVERLDRMATEVARAGEVVADQAAVAG
jgi:hypothetical protein